MEPFTTIPGGISIPFKGYPELLAIHHFNRGQVESFCVQRGSTTMENLQIADEQIPWEKHFYYGCSSTCTWEQKCPDCLEVRSRLFDKLERACEKLCGNDKIRPTNAESESFSSSGEELDKILSERKLMILDKLEREGSHTVENMLRYQKQQQWPRHFYKKDLNITMLCRASQLCDSCSIKRQNHLEAVNMKLYKANTMFGIREQMNSSGNSSKNTENLCKEMLQKKAFRSLSSSVRTIAIPETADEVAPDISSINKNGAESLCLRSPVSTPFHSNKEYASTRVSPLFSKLPPANKRGLDWSNTDSKSANDHPTRRSADHSNRAHVNAVASTSITILPVANKHGVESPNALSESSNDFPFKSTIDQTDGAIDTCGDSTGKLVPTNAMKPQHDYDDVEGKYVAEKTKHDQLRNGRIRQPKDIQQKYHSLHLQHVQQYREKPHKKNNPSPENLRYKYYPQRKYHRQRKQEKHKELLKANKEPLKQYSSDNEIEKPQMQHISVDKSLSYYKKIDSSSQKQEETRDKSNNQGNNKDLELKHEGIHQFEVSTSTLPSSTNDDKEVIVSENHATVEFFRDDNEVKMRSIDEYAKCNSTYDLAQRNKCNSNKTSSPVDDDKVQTANHVPSDLYTGARENVISKGEHKQQKVTEIRKTSNLTPKMSPQSQQHPNANITPNLAVNDLFRGMQNFKERLRRKKSCKISFSPRLVLFDISKKFAGNVNSNNSSTVGYSGKLSLTTLGNDSNILMDNLAKPLSFRERSTGSTE